MSKIQIENNAVNQRIRFDPLIVGSNVRDWFLLLKPRVISLVVFTGIVGIILAPGYANPFISLISIICICLASGGAGAINMWYDQDIDRVMNRTITRPLPSGRVQSSDALIYGVTVSIISVILMFLATNFFASFILAFSIFYYSVIYTVWLKRSTPQNIVIGGAAGAFPPLIGWISVTGQIQLFPIILFLIVFFWTPPHFWSLSLYACKDYGRAGIPMLPVVKGARHTRWQIFIYTILLAIVSLLPVYFHFTHSVYMVAALILNVGFMFMAICVLLEKQDHSGKSLRSDKAARWSFRFSLIYLFFLFLALIIDHYIYDLWGV
ncbi:MULTISPECIES: heme o synthase [Commensalibacter]|uniref:heme o synthase n=1 Tax=Commensalibacter TaxID=1079922 RepID=UPI0012D9F7EE|nr:MULTISPECIES: heme o synthase [Commensalibacter]MCT6841777.1 heme o synthase [Commensalibacter sp.]MBH9969396.1 protoheme IX farnesyltransferase [Commensalibacter sp. M0265]MBH9973035.1 protoheme IX farnesyltransferase [Commensalibacter melissae]MBH9976751.1 protoheme IX farnesyltransferase [Commensalibacter sp. M0266]MBH9992312.1 protoheme IX farnesyltransferase [Commensalibacter sp. M0270]